jgi:hypothetical protein
MPKCINDKLKNYTGKEPSPKGLGYCSSSEEVGKIMIGKDGANWIVTQTKTCKKWLKVNNKTKKKKEKFIDLNNLDEDCYTYSYIPNVDEKELDNESGLEEKFGGSKPFFIEGEAWPLSNKECMMEFICQFKDPRKKDNILIRIFSNGKENDEDEDENDDEDEDSKNDSPLFKILSIELTEENLKKQIILTSPRNQYKAFEIKNWNPSKEFKSIIYIINKYSLHYDDDYLNRYFDSKYTPSKETKLGGTHLFNGSLGNISEDANFLQLNNNYSKYLPFISEYSNIQILFWDKNEKIILY